MTVGLLRAGVPFGATMSFVLASPLLNPIILTMFWALLGWKACLIYGAVTFLAAMACGALLQALGLARDVKTVRISGGARAAEAASTFGSKLARSLPRSLGRFPRRAGVPFDRRGHWGSHLRLPAE